MSKQNSWFTYILEGIKKSSTFITLAFIVLTISYILTLSQGASVLKDFYNSTIGYNSIMLKRLDRLSADTNINYFIDMIGNPVFINNVSDENKKYKEYIFVDKLFYVQAITDIDDKVLVYSITTRDKNFNPKLKLWDVTIELGKTKFSELDSLGYDPVRVVSFLAAHDFHYGEEYYFGNPANYQSYVFSLNESGYWGIAYNGEEDFVAPPHDPWIDGIIDKENEEIKNFRENSVINTYTITSPLLANFREKDGTIDLPTSQYGPSWNQVRVLPD